MDEPVFFSFFLFLNLKTTSGRVAIATNPLPPGAPDSLRARENHDADVEVLRQHRGGDRLGATEQVACSTKRNDHESDNRRERRRRRRDRHRPPSRSRDQGMQRRSRRGCGPFLLSFDIHTRSLFELILDRDHTRVFVTCGKRCTSCFFLLKDGISGFDVCMRWCEWTTLEAGLAGITASEGKDVNVIGVWRGTNYWPDHFSLATDVDVFESLPPSCPPSPPPPAPPPLPSPPPLLPSPLPGGNLSATPSSTTLNATAPDAPDAGMIVHSLVDVDLFCRIEGG